LAVRQQQQHACTQVCTAQVSQQDT
jgi:hypothetical protein